MTRSDRDTLSTALKAQADLFERSGAKKLARDLRRRAQAIATDIHDALTGTPSSNFEPIPVRVRERQHR